jgi:hypothetical protein
MYRLQFHPVQNAALICIEFGTFDWLFFPGFFIGHPYRQATWKI